MDPCTVMLENGLEPDDLQTEFLRCEDEIILLNIHRQAGKTTTTAAKNVAKICGMRGFGSVIVSPTQEQSGIAFRKLIEMFDGLGQPVRPVKKTERQLYLENGSWVVSLPGLPRSVRGYSAPRMVTMDEGSQIPDLLFDAVRPMLATVRGQLIIPSTPFGQRGRFFAMWQGYDKQPEFDINSEAWWEWRRTHPDGVTRYMRPATECPRITTEWLERERRQSPSDWYFDQEFLCKFRQQQDAVFDAEALARTLSDDVEPLFADLGLPMVTPKLSADVEPLFME